MIIDEAISVLKQEAESILHLTEKIGYDFEQMVEVICNSTGRVIISGIGKSGLIAGLFNSNNLLKFNHISPMLSRSI